MDLADWTKNVLHKTVSMEYNIDNNATLFKICPHGESYLPRNISWNKLKPVLTKPKFII